MSKTPCLLTPEEPPPQLPPLGVATPPGQKVSHEKGPSRGTGRETTELQGISHFHHEQYPTVQGNAGPCLVDVGEPVHKCRGDRINFMNSQGAADQAAVLVCRLRAHSFKRPDLALSSVTWGQALGPTRSGVEASSCSPCSPFGYSPACAGVVVEDRTGPWVEGCSIFKLGLGCGDPRA